MLCVIILRDVIVKKGRRGVTASIIVIVTLYVGDGSSISGSFPDETELFSFSLPSSSPVVSLSPLSRCGDREVIRQNGRLQRRTVHFFALISDDRDNCDKDIHTSCTRFSYRLLTLQLVYKFQEFFVDAAAIDKASFLFLKNI